MQNTVIQKPTGSLFKAYVIFFLSASFYLYEYILQVAPSVMASPMMQTFHISAEGFGIISAFYFYAYAPMQLPAGLLYDRFGPRRLMTVALCLCALGSFFFASTESLWTAALGRFFIGTGSAFSFVGVLVLLSRWFPPHYFALLAGITQLMSSVGAIFGQMPLAAFIDIVGWRNASFILSLLGFLLALLMWIVVRDHPNPCAEHKINRSWSEEGKRFLLVCKRSSTWRIGIYAFAIWTPIAVFGALWGVPFLQEKYHISVIGASSLCSMIWLGIGVGSPLLGWLSDKWASRRLALILGSICGLSSAIFLLYVPNISMALMYPILFLFGFGAGGQTVSFALIYDECPQELLGTACGLNNLFVLIGGAIFQPLVGVLLDRCGATLINGVAQYSITAYQWSLSVLPLCFAGSLFLALWGIRETHPSQNHFSEHEATGLS
ncbi:MAG: MFS transporter [Legionellaceae bacterium]|nr:MFS transporter [Legionellaceae bacterium]